jgi:hypothetical protein
LPRINKDRLRCVLESGNDIGEEHIEEAITKAKEYAEEINKYLDLPDCQFQGKTDDLIVAAESVNI